MVEEEEILQIIDDLKESMPAELEQSKKILAERDKVIADAQHHADGMVAQAKDYIAKLTEESELVRQAQERANQVIQTANDSSEQLKIAPSPMPATSSNTLNRHWKRPYPAFSRIAKAC